MQRVAGESFHTCHHDPHHIVDLILQITSSFSLKALASEIAQLCPWRESVCTRSSLHRLCCSTLKALDGFVLFAVNQLDQTFGRENFAPLGSFTDFSKGVEDSANTEATSSLEWALTSSDSMTMC
jgi:hypothetical protein